MSASFCDCVNQWEQEVGLQVLKDTKYLSLRTRGEWDYTSYARIIVLCDVMCEEDVWKMTLDDRCVEPLLGWCQSEQWTLAQSSSDIDPPPATVCRAGWCVWVWAEFCLIYLTSVSTTPFCKGCGLWCLISCTLHLKESLYCLGKVDGVLCDGFIFIIHF